VLSKEHETVRVDFIAVDVETANPNLASVCQVGIVVFPEKGSAEKGSV
jgi:hypothetical protein